MCVKSNIRYFKINLFLVTNSIGRSNPFRAHRGRGSSIIKLVTTIYHNRNDRLNEGFSLFIEHKVVESNIKYRTYNVITTIIDKCDKRNMKKKKSKIIKE